ncbi:MOSC domain-containing protein [Thalassomonas viridans]|uniref:MOSC domain-containing protein n=1 Tax=Thalassomonas viridans TaxID=137584 RepID=A0AAE9ZA74_9GAMM|nr:MOSC domain-containing protein [Thalassomonas viridans]WDE07847.1 MOSC domain-containing protein [Thalassomonas viridans]
MIEEIYPNSIFCGKVQQSFGIETAIAKSAVDLDIYLSFDGLEDDECADKRHHGGLDRALHQYPAEHYEYWRKRYGDKHQWQAPGMGENLSTAGMTEDNVCLGDRYAWGEAIIEVSQPRSPCFKLNTCWQIADLSVHMQASSRCGWLYRVIQPGLVGAEQPLQLIERVADAFTIREVCHFFFGEPLNRDGLLRLKQQTRLSNSWKDKVQQRLATGEVEDWERRLLGQIAKV